MGCRSSKDERPSKPTNTLKPVDSSSEKVKPSVRTQEVDVTESPPQSRRGSLEEDSAFSPTFFDCMSFANNSMIIRDAECAAITDLPGLTALETRRRKDILRAEATVIEAIAALSPVSALTDVSLTEEGALPDDIACLSPRSQKKGFNFKHDQIRAHFGWEHLAASEPFTEWINGFLENKNYDVPETIAKLERRIALEEDEFATMPMPDSSRKLLANGVGQKVGVALDGSDVLYIVTKRDFPTKKNLADRKRNFDIMMTYASRYPYKGFTLLVNQDQASAWSNTDMPFSSAVALRISKFWPGALKRIILMKMGTAVSALIKPAIGLLPQQLSSKILVLSDTDIQKGKLQTVLPPESIPKEFGGLYTADNQTSWDSFADTVYDHFESFQTKRPVDSKNSCIARTECEEARAKKSA